MEQPANHAPISIRALADRYCFATCGSIGKSLLGKEISFLRIGNADCNLLYVAGASACEHLGKSVLLLFAHRLCEFIQKDRSAYGICPTYLLENRSIYILPCLNPDGEQIAASGADPTCPLYERQLRLNGMQSDFSRWQGNARGVHPGQNFNFTFAKRKKSLLQSEGYEQCQTGEFPESEPESAALASLARILKPNCLIQVKQGKPGLSCFPSDLPQIPALCRMTGLSAFHDEDDILGGWFHSELGKPGLVLQLDDRAEIAYTKLQNVLFGACFLFGGRQK